MSDGSNVMPRHPLGLPPGSVRAVLVFQIVAQFWLLVALRNLPIPLYLYALLALVLVFFTTSGRHMKLDSEETGPLGSPKWLFGIVLSLATIGLLVWQHLRPVPDGGKSLAEFLTPIPEQLKWWPYTGMCLMGGYAFGRLLRAGPWSSSAIFQDILAWLSLLGMLGLLIELLLQTLIYPGSSAPLGENAQAWEAGLTAVVAVYFGARS